MKLKFKYLPALSLLVAASASAATTTAPVSQDGWGGPEGPAQAGATVVQDGGTGPQLNIATPNPSGASQYTRKAWFGFDLTALKTAVGTNNICSASITFQLSTNVDSGYSANNAIRFYGVTNVTPGSIDGTATNDSFFDETTLTWANAPGNIAGDVLAGDKINGSTLGDVPVPSPAASGVMVLTGPQVISFLQSSMSGTNKWATVAATYEGQSNTGYGNNAAGFPTGLSFVSKEGGTGSAFISVSYQATPCAMTLLSQPQSGCFYPGSTVGLSVTASGAPPILYQWTKNGTNVPGATLATLNLIGLQASDAGLYQALLYNPSGSLTSSVSTVSVTAPPSLAGGFEQAVGTNAPIGYWRFNETMPVLDDVGTNQGTVGNPNLFYYINQPNHGQPGAIVGNPDKSTQFSAASSQYLQVPYMADFNPQPPFSLEFWAKADITACTTCPFGSLYRSGNNAAGWIFYMNGGAWNFRMGNTTNNYSVNLSTTGTASTNQWYHVVGTYDGAVAILYVNGVQISSVATSAFEPNPVYGLGIGARGDNAFWFSGSVDEAAIYTNLLSSTDVANHYSNGTNSARTQSYSSLVLAKNPVGYWRLDEPIVKVTSANHGTRCASADAVYVPYGTSAGVLGIATGDPGPVPPDALGFEPANLAVNLSGSTVQIPALNINKNTATIAAWINPNTLEPQWAGIVFNRSGSTTAGLHFGTAGELRYTWAGTGSTYNWNSGLIPPQNAWSFVAVVIEPTKATMYLYDGVNFSSAVNTTAHAVQGFTGTTLIGRDPNNNTRTYTGDIDEVAIYDQSLTAAQIAGLAGAARFGTVPPSIVAGPFPQQVFAGEPATFTAVAGGSLPLSFQWSAKGVAIAGATTSSLTLPSVGYADAGAYSVVVVNARGSAVGATTLAVALPNPAFANLTNSLVLHLKFDGAYTDSSGRGNDATPMNNTSFVAGKLGQAVHVNTDIANGIYNYVEILNAAAGLPYTDLQFAAADSFSVSFWVHYTGLPNDLPMIGNAMNSTYSPGWVFTDDSGKMEWTMNSVSPDTGGLNVDPIPGSPLTHDGVWHNVVASFDRNSKLGNTYVDGALVDSRSIASIGNLDTGYGIFLGQDPSGSYTPGSTFVGAYDIDDLGIWRRALARSEAESIYAVGQNHAASFDTYGPVKLSVQKTATGLQLLWQAGTLLSAPSPKGPWTPVTGATAPAYQVNPTGSNLFYRVQL